MRRRSSSYYAVEELNKAARSRFCELIHRCLAFDPERRPGVGLVSDELKKIAADMGNPISDEE